MRGTGWISVMWLLFLMGITVGCVSPLGEDRDSDSLQIEVSEITDITVEAQEWADSVCESMTLREQVGQLLLPALYSRDDAATMRLLRYYADSLHVGGVVLLKGDLEAASAIADSLVRFTGVNMGGPGPFVAIDAETGLGMRLEDAPLFPWNSRLSKEADDQLLFDYGREVARESRLAGINMILGPVLDVDRRPSGGGRRAMWLRSLGSDPDRVARLSVAYARGLEGGGVISVAKHFPGHGATSTDTHRRLARITTGNDELSLIDLEPFRQYADNGLTGMLVGHLWVEAVDSVCRPASFSPLVIGELLRERLQFRGLVLTDALNMEGATGYDAADAIKAGADMIVAPADTRRAVENILSAVADGSLSELTLADRCRRILFYKYLFGVPFAERAGLGLTAPELRMEVSKGSDSIELLLSQ